MSRSYKKNPFVSNAGRGKGLKKDKRHAQRRIRRNNTLEDLPDGNHFKKIEDNWNWVGEGKQYWDNPKAYIK